MSPTASFLLSAGTLRGLTVAGGKSQYANHALPSLPSADTVYDFALPSVPMTCVALTRYSRVEMNALALSRRNNMAPILIKGPEASPGWFVGWLVGSFVGSFVG